MALLSGRVAVVTGASSGIGRAIARALGAAGARVCLLGRDRARLAAAAAEAGEEALPLAADLTRDGEMSAALDLLARALPAPSILVHSAGVYARGSTAAAPVADLDGQYAANMRAPWLLTQRLLPGLSRGGGDVVFINSSQGLSAGAGVGQFAATQHAMRGFADALRQEVNGAGIRVLVLHAGRTATPRQADIFAAEGRAYAPERLMQPEDVAALVLAAVALPRTAEVTTLAVRPMLKG